MVLDRKEVEIKDEGTVTPRQGVIDYPASSERASKSECRGSAKRRRKLRCQRGWR